MLTPAANDPKRKEELERKQRDPGSFGAPWNPLVKNVLTEKK